MGAELVTLLGDDTELSGTARRYLPGWHALSVTQRKRVLRVHPELLGIWPVFVKAAQLARKGIRAASKEIKYKRGKRQKAAAAKQATAAAETTDTAAALAQAKAKRTRIILIVGGVAIVGIGAVLLMSRE